MALERSLSLEMGNSEYLGWHSVILGVQLGQEIGLFFFLAAVKEWDSKYLGLCWSELYHCRLKAALNCTYQMGVVVFQKTLDRNKADLIPRQSLLTPALEKTLKFRIHFLHSLSMTLLFKSIFHLCGAVKYWATRFIFICLCVCALSHIWLFVTPRTVACQAPLYMEFSRQEYWSGQQIPTPGDLPNPRIEPVSLVSPVLAGRPWWLRWWICLQCRRPGLDLWVGKISYRREWQPTPVFLPGESHGQRNFVGYSPLDCIQSDMIERLIL